MNCPKCSAAMKLLTVGAYTVDRCTGCAGLWFNLREHEHIAELPEQVQRLDTGEAAKGVDQNQKRDIACPACNVKMLKLSVPTQSHIKYESCPVCHGAFFDAGEFKDYSSRTLGEQVSLFFRGFRQRSTK